MSYVTVPSFVGLVIFTSISIMALVCFCYWLHSRLEKQQYVRDISEASMPYVLSDINAALASTREKIRDIRANQRTIITLFRECKEALRHSPTFNDYANAIEKDEQIGILYRRLEGMMPSTEITEIEETQMFQQDSSKGKVN